MQSASSTSGTSLDARIASLPAWLARATAAIWLLAAALGAGCGNRAVPGEPDETRTYEIRGQVLGVRPDVGEVRIRHEAIPGYMDAMTMSFAVKERRLLEGRKRGDLVRGTLVVTETDAWLSALETTGTAPVEAEAFPPSPPAAAFTLLQPGEAIPDEALVDQEGQPWRPSLLKGRAYALTFIYTRCPLPTYCPMMDRHFRAVQQAASTRPDLRDRVHLVTVSFDPDFDRPAVLKTHARSLGADLSTWTFVTGERGTVEAFGSRLGLSVMRDGSTGDVTHNLRTAVVSPDGTLVRIHNGNEWTPSQLVADLEAATRR